MTRGSKVKIMLKLLRFVNERISSSISAGRSGGLPADPGGAGLTTLGGDFGIFCIAGPVHEPYSAFAPTMSLPICRHDSGLFSASQISSQDKPSSAPSPPF